MAAGDGPNVVRHYRATVHLLLPFLSLCSSPLGIPVTRSPARYPTSHFASRKVFKISNLNSSSHPRVKQSRVRLTPAPRTSSKQLKELKADLCSDPGRPPPLAARALARAQ